MLLIHFVFISESTLIEESEKISLFIEKGEEIKRKTAHIMIIGFPGSGKSHLLDNLLHRKRNNHSFSTDISDSVVVVDVTGGDTSSHSTVIGGQGLSWKMIESKDAIMNELLHSHKQAIPDEIQQITDSATMPSQKQGLLDEMPQHSTATKPEPTTSLQNDVLRVLKQSNITSYEQLKSTFSLYIRDTGGQVEFQEVLSILINGPSIFFFVMKANLSLDKPLTLQYRNKNGLIDSYESATTTRQTLIQTLTTIRNTDGPTDVSTHDPVVFIIGTHTDKIDPRESEEGTIKKLNAELHDLIKSHNFVDIVEYQDEKSKTVIFPVSNKHFKSESESKKFEDIKERVDKKIYGMPNFAIKYPLGYLLFCLELHHCQDDVLYREECEKIAAKFEISGDKKVTKMLNTLHHRIGIIQYYNIDGLKHLVIIKPEVLFKRLTELMVKTFPSYQGSSPKTKSDLLYKGIIEASELEHFFTKKSKMTSKDFIAFLEHLRIAASFIEKDDNKKYFFIPSAICHSQGKKICDIAKSKVCPLAITFKCSSCPKGVFGMTVCHFMSIEEKENPYTFLLERENIYRDIVCLEMRSSSCETQGNVFLCQISNTHIEVHFCPYQDDENFELLAPMCDQIRIILMEGIRRSLSKLNYIKKRVGAKESLQCHSCKELHKKATSKGRVSIKCKKLTYPRNCCSCWFNKGRYYYIMI